MERNLLQCFFGQVTGRAKTRTSDIGSPGKTNAAYLETAATGRKTRGLCCDHLLKPWGRTFICAVILVLAGSVRVAGRNAQNDATVHHFEMACDNCHNINHNMTEHVSEMGALNGNINTLCTQQGCHDFDRSLNHPVGLVPHGNVPDDMPLDNNSRITCLTCHDERNASDDSAGHRSGYDKMLRRPSVTELCAACHTEGAEILSANSHWRFLRRAHLGPINSRSSSPDEHVRAGRLDLESRKCLSCHDDLTVVIPTDNETPRQRKRRRRNTSSHPIGMSYENAALRQPDRYNYPLMDRRIRFFDGRMGCGSCHNPYSSVNKMLVIPNTRSELCRKCHIR